MSHTTFHLYDKADKQDNASEILSEPLLASFPNNMPTQEALSTMQFNILQQHSDNKNSKSSRKRVIKAEHKGVKYIAKSNIHDVLPKDQASDYYIGVFNTSDNKVYMVPIRTPYQFNQEIDNFKETYGQEEDNDAFKSMSYMDHKLQLVNAFGTKKAKQKVNSMLTNMVNEGEPGQVTNKKGGTRDQRLTERAKHVQDEQINLKKDLLTSSSRRQNLYSHVQLLPAEIMADIPYKETYVALQSNDEATLSRLIRNSTVRGMLLKVYSQFGTSFVHKKEKKMALKGHIYLDVLITFFRMPPHIEDSPEEVSKKLKMPLTPIVDHILEEFAQISAKNQQKMNQQQDESEYGGGDQSFKYVKSKELTKKLMCHILGIAVLISKGTPLKASSMAQILRKEVTELKSYFQELGLHFDSVREGGVEDLIVTGVASKEKKPKEDTRKKGRKEPTEEEINEGRILF